MRRKIGGGWRRLAAVAAVAWIAAAWAGASAAADVCERVVRPADIPAKVMGFLGSDALGVIAGADRVETFQLRPSMAPGGNAGPDAIGGYAWKARGADFAPAAVADLKRMLLDAGSYDFAAVKKCPFVPEYALRFRKGCDGAVVLLSFGCGMWGVAGPGEPRTANFDPARDRLRAIVETVFKLN